MKWSSKFPKHKLFFLQRTTINFLRAPLSFLSLRCCVSCLESCDRLEQVLALLHKVNLLHAVDGGLDPLLVVDHLVLDLALENPVGEESLLEDLLELLGVAVFEVLVHFVRSDSAKHELGLVVEGGGPRAAGVVDHSQGVDVTAAAVVVLLVAPLAHPVVVRGLDDLAHVTAGLLLVGAGRVPWSALLVLLDEGDGALKGEPVSLR